MFVYGAPVETLHVFAVKTLKLRREWFQSPPKASLPHYDLTPSKRALAVKHGAVDLSDAEDESLNATVRALRQLSAIFLLLGPTTEVGGVPTSTICAFCGNGALQHAIDLTGGHVQSRVLCNGNRVFPKKL